MKITQTSFAAVIAAFVLALPAVQARPDKGNPGTPPGDPGKGQPPVDQPVPPVPPADDSGKGKPTFDPSAKGGPVDSKGIKLPDSVKNDAALQALLAEAEKQKDAFIASQKDLLAKIKGATTDQKSAIKDQLKDNQQKFLDDTKQLRADIADRLKELGVDLKTRGINAGNKEGGQHKRPGQ